MNNPNNKDGKPIVDFKTSGKSRPMIKQIPAPRRSCLKHQTNRRPENVESGRSSIGAGRVSFAHATSNDGRVFFTSQSQNDVIDHKSRSDIFAKKAKELQLAELTYFKTHAGDKASTDE